MPLTPLTPLKNCTVTRARVRKTKKLKKAIGHWLLVRLEKLGSLAMLFSLFSLNSLHSLYSLPPGIVFDTQEGGGRASFVPGIVFDTHEEYGQKKRPRKLLCVVGSLNMESSTFYSCNNCRNKLQELLSKIAK